MLEEIAGGGGLAKAIHAHHRAFETDVLSPIVADACLDRYLWELPRQHGVPVSRVLAVENAGGGHGDEPHRDAGLRELLLGGHGGLDLRTGGDDDGPRRHRAGKHVTTPRGPTQL